VTAGPGGPATSGGAPGPEVPSEDSPGDDAGRDEKVLALRERGSSFSSIARALGLEKAAQANAAFNRALRLRAADEQQILRSHEMARLDALGERLRQREDLDEAERARRAKSLDRLRRLLSA